MPLCRIFFVRTLKHMALLFTVVLVVLVVCVFVVVSALYQLTNCMTFRADDYADFLIVVIVLLTVALLMTLPFFDY